MPAEPRDLLITATETNSHHGVGILLQRCFPDSSSFVCVRTTSLYNGEEPFGSAHHELCSRGLGLLEIEHHLRQILDLYSIRRILCVPYYREEFIHAVVAKRLTGAPLCTFLMDDQNVFVPNVPDHWVADLLAASDLRLAISPEMAAAYARKYGHPLHVLPPLLERPEPLVPCYWSPEPGEPLRAAMIGNVWTAHRFAQLRELTRANSLHLDWYGNGPKASWLKGTPEEWEADHIRCLGFLPEEDLVAALASYPFVLVPSGSLDAQDDNPAFARLSLPSRLLFLHARTDTPVLIFGSADTAAGRFVTHLGTGLCSPGDPASFRSTFERLLHEPTRQGLRARIRAVAPHLVHPQTGNWIWQSLAAGTPLPAAFQQFFPDDYLADMPGLDAIRPASPRAVRVLPAPGEPFRDEHAPAFGFLRRRHLPVITASGLTIPDASALEPSYLSSAAAHYIVRGAAPEGGDLLFLGPDTQLFGQSPPARFRVWQIADLAAWQRAGYSGDPAHVVAAGTGAPYPHSFPQFSAIVSTYWCGQLGDDPHVHEGLSLFLEGCTAPQGVNIHFFAAVLQPGFFWTGPVHGYLRRRFLKDHDWPDLDELLSTDDFFVMSEEVYNRQWKPATGKSYAAFGKALALGLFWRKP